MILFQFSSYPVMVMGSSFQFPIFEQDAQGEEHGHAKIVVMKIMTTSTAVEYAGINGKLKIIKININSFMFNKYNYKYWIIYSFFLLFCLCNFYLIGKQNLGDILETIPKNDKERLEKFFQTLCNSENFSYTLFGDKPMSLACYLTTPFDSEGNPASRGELRFKRGWEIWQKYAHLFPIMHYLLVENPIAHNKYKDIVLINKKCFIEKINEHLHLFQKLLGKDINGTLLLKKIEENPKVLSLFDQHPLLLGILLGYGEHNARLYAKRDKLSHFVYKKKIPKIPVKIPIPSAGFSSLQEEFNSYFPILTLFGDSGYSPLIIGSLHFVADHKHPETIALQNKYSKMRGEISAIYANGNFLEITLSKLMRSTHEKE